MPLILKRSGGVEDVLLKRTGGWWGGGGVGVMFIKCQGVIEEKMMSWTPTLGMEPNEFRRESLNHLTVRWLGSTTGPEPRKHPPPHPQFVAALVSTF